MSTVMTGLVDATKDLEVFDATHAMDFVTVDRAQRTQRLATVITKVKELSEWCFSVDTDT